MQLLQQLLSGLKDYFIARLTKSILTWFSCTVGVMYFTKHSQLYRKNTEPQQQTWTNNDLEEVTEYLNYVFYK